MTLLEAARMVAPMVGVECWGELNAHRREQFKEAIAATEKRWKECDHPYPDTPYCERCGMPMREAT